jgi:hypothetical protein
MYLDENDPPALVAILPDTVARFPSGEAAREWPSMTNEEGDRDGIFAVRDGFGPDPFLYVARREHPPIVPPHFP